MLFAYTNATLLLKWSKERSDVWPATDSRGRSGDQKDQKDSSSVSEKPRQLPRPGRAYPAGPAGWACCVAIKCLIINK